jgi:hypothetical protein
LFLDPWECVLQVSCWPLPIRRWGIITESRFFVRDLTSRFALLCLPNALSSTNRSVAATASPTATNATRRPAGRTFSAAANAKQRPSPRRQWTAGLTLSNALMASAMIQRRCTPTSFASSNTNDASTHTLCIDWPTTPIACD